MMSRRFVLLASALFLVAAACGGGDDDAAEGVASLSGATDDAVIAVPQPEDEIVELTEEEALLAFTACMRENDIAVEDPTISADGSVEFRFRGGAGPEAEDFDREAARAAREQCADLLEGVTLGFGRQDQTELQDDLFNYAACMRDNGYDMDDPDFGNFSPGSGGDGEPGEFRGPFGAIDPEDPDFIAADEACSDILSGFGSGGGGFRGGPGGGGAVRDTGVNG
jgi:hypothetical protein